MNDIPKHCYVGRKPCGCVVSMVADMSGKSETMRRCTADAIHELIMAGMAIERMTVDEALAWFAPDCPHGETGAQTQLELGGKGNG